ncbi:MAG: hypothetical protein HKN82_19220 [Akkermansiaceae bacterium]|nr:hypothetical protein [Akkermansiaceae bacterium]NNM30036.1 hypothetical protein [Akkermansiaceae bacterium]
MKYAAPLAIALIVLFPSCATQPQAGTPGAPAPTDEPGTPPQAPNSAPGVTPMGVYRGAQQAAGAINTVRTFAVLF